MEKRIETRIERICRTTAVLALAGASLWGCGGAGPDAGGHPAPAAGAKGGAKAGAARGGGPPGGGWNGAAGADPEAAVPVEVTPVVRRDIASYLETTGALEAENEVDIVARTAGPIVELVAEEGMRVRQGQLLARIDETEYRAQVEIARVALEEAKRAYERAKISLENEIISQEVYDQTLARYESARAQLEGAQILLGYTRITAPFDGVIVRRHVKLAENVTPNQVLFRISDFDPLLCPVQIPEKELARLRVGQPAHLSVDAYPGERFSGRVLRVSPVVDAATGTIRVTIEVDGRGKLRPGMFASVFLVMDRHENALAIPKAALALDSLADTVYVAKGNVAERREVSLGFEEENWVEVVSGLAEGEDVIVVGQDGLSDGTPIYVLSGSPGGPGPGRAAEGAVPRAPASPAEIDPERLERIKERMRARGMSEEEIEQALERRRRAGGRP